MDFIILNPDDFMSDGIFRFADFIDKTDAYDWEQFRGKDLLISGCGDTITPPWVYINLAARLGKVAKSIHYGSEAEALKIINLNSESSNKRNYEREI